MKSKSLLLAIVCIVSTSILLSCNKNSNPATSSTNQSSTVATLSTGLSYSKWGEYHNQALALSEYYWVADTTYTYDSLIKVMQVEMGKIYPDFASINKTDLENAIADPVFSYVLNTRPSSPAQATAVFRKVLSDKLNEGKISQNLHDGLYEVFDASLTQQEVIEKIDNINLATLDQGEQNTVIATRSILVNSYDLWTNWEASHPGERALRGKWRPTNGQMCVLVDGVVGAGFSITGALAVLMAAAASVAWAD